VPMNSASRDIESLWYMQAPLVEKQTDGNDGASLAQRRAQ
jgi:hypothetical protein